MSIRDISTVKTKLLSYCQSLENSGYCLLSTDISMCRLFFGWVHYKGNQVVIFFWYDIKAFWLWIGHCCIIAQPKHKVHIWWIYACQMPGSRPNTQGQDVADEDWNSGMWGLEPAIFAANDKVQVKIFSKNSCSHCCIFFQFWITYNRHNHSADCDTWSQCALWHMITVCIVTHDHSVHCDTWSQCALWHTITVCIVTHDHSVHCGIWS